MTLEWARWPLRSCRGYHVYETRGKTVHDSSPDVPRRPGWVEAVPLDPMDESGEED